MPDLLVDDVAFSVESELALEPTNSTNPTHGPDSAEFRPVRWRRRPYDQLLEAVLQAARAGVTARDSLRTSLVDRIKQRLLSAWILRVDGP